MTKHTTKSDNETSTPPWAKVVAAAARDARLSENHFRTLIAVSSFANWVVEDGRGEAWPVLATIHAKFGIPRSTLSRCTRNLEAWGYFSIEKRSNPRGHGGRPANRYWVMLDVEVPPEFDKSKCHKLGTPTAKEVASSMDAEVASSRSMEQPTSTGRNFNKEQTTGTDAPSTNQTEQTNLSSRALDPSADAEGPADNEAKIRIRRGLAFPKEFAGMANGCGLNKQSRPVEWEAFLEKHAGEIVAMSELRQMFKRWAQDARVMGFVTMPEARGRTLLLPAEFEKSARQRGLTDKSIDAAWRTFCAHRAGETKCAREWRKEWGVWCARQSTNMETQYAGTRIDPNMPLSAEDRAIAIKIGLNEAWIDRHWWEFRAEMNAATGKKGFSLNWHDRWRHWCMRKFENRITNDERFAERYGL